MTPPTPTASKYSIVGYATTYRWWFYPNREGREPPAVKNGPFPFPEQIKISELPSRLRIAQFLILPHHHRSGHGTQLYTTIHRICVEDPTIVELTVEDPNEAFDELRDMADYHILRPEFLRRELNINPNPYPANTGKKRPRLMPTAALIPTKTLHEIRSKYKIAPTQFAHILEAFLLSRIPFKQRAARNANMARLLIKKHNAEDENDRRYYWWRMLVKQRLYKRSRDVLIQLELNERVQKLDETLANVEEGYEKLLERFGNREERIGKIAEEEVDPKASMAEGNANGTPGRDHTKRKYTVIEDDEDEGEGPAEAAKKAKI